MLLALQQVRATQAGMGMLAAEPAVEAGAGGLGAAVEGEGVQLRLAADLHHDGGEVKGGVALLLHAHEVHMGAVAHDQFQRGVGLVGDAVAALEALHQRHLGAVLHHHDHAAISGGGIVAGEDIGDVQRRGDLRPADTRTSRPSPRKTVLRASGAS